MLKKISNDPELLGINEDALHDIMTTDYHPSTPEHSATGWISQGRVEFEYNFIGFTGNYRQIA